MLNDILFAPERKIASSTFLVYAACGTLVNLIGADIYLLASEPQFRQSKGMDDKPYRSMTAEQIAAMQARRVGNPRPGRLHFLSSPDFLTTMHALMCLIGAFIFLFQYFRHPEQFSLISLILWGIWLIPLWFYLFATLYCVVNWFRRPKQAK